MRIAVVQMDVRLGDVDRNLAVILDRLRESRKQGADLTIFPECALTGYCFENLVETRPFAQPVPGPATTTVAGVLAAQGGAAIVGMVEQASDVGIHNVAVLVTGKGVVATYRKIHLPHLGLDQFSSYGQQPFAVRELEFANSPRSGTATLRVGMSICYDSAFPESIRILSLLGADLIALPTNFPTGAESMTDHVIRTRALENSVYFACCNRVGTERGFRFIGGSQIVDPAGQVLAKAGEMEETILIADIDPARARNKRVVRSPGKHAIDRLADRRPEMYGLLTEPHHLRRPRDDR